MRTTLLIATIVLIAASAIADDSPEIPFELPLLEGWRSETIPFPLDFAPELEYEGFEELRFAPGMFDEESDDFWTYAFVWWVALDTKISSELITADLESYFRGLANAVAKSREFDPGDTAYEVTLQETPSPYGTETFFDAFVDTFDPFVTRDALSLHGRVEVVRCHKEEHTAVLFLFSPKSRSDSVWESLREIRDGFRCSK